MQGPVEKLCYDILGFFNLPAPPSGRTLLQFRKLHL